MPPTSNSNTYPEVILPIIKNVLPNILAHNIRSVQPMASPMDPRFELTGIKQLDHLVFELYRNTEDARTWLEDTPLSYSIIREAISVGSLVQIFKLRVRYASGTTFIPSSTDPYELWRVTFTDPNDAALFKLSWL